MIVKSPPASSTTKLLDDLKMLKESLDNDDNVPLLLGEPTDSELDDDLDGEIPVLANTGNDDDDIPVLANDDEDDIPVLDASPESGTPLNTQQRSDTDQASLDAALKQLETMQLAPTASSKKEIIDTNIPKRSITGQIRASASAPIIKEEDLSTVRDNPFLNVTQKKQLDQSRRLREESQKLAMISSLQKHKSKAVAPVPKPKKDPIEKPKDEAIKEPAKEKQIENKPVNEKSIDIDATLKDIDKELDGLGEIILPEENANIETQNNKPQEKEINLIIDDVVDEYITILEAALRKKLKEKLPELLK